MEDRYLKSSFYEQLVEHVFIAEVLQESWYRFGTIVEVLRSEVDASGYDIVFECGDVIRHVQLKASHEDSRSARQKVNVALARKPSGCVVWLIRSEDRETHRMGLRYRFFGGSARERLPSLDEFPVGKHTKGDSTGEKKDRPAIRVVPKRAFVEAQNVTELVRKLFDFNDPAAG